MNGRYVVRIRQSDDFGNGEGFGNVFPDIRGHFCQPDKLVEAKSHSSLKVSLIHTFRVLVGTKRGDNVGPFGPRTVKRQHRHETR